MLATYDPLLVIATWGTIISGYADGSMIEADYNEDAFSDKVGTQGDTVHIRSRNENGTITVNLQQSSPLNEVFSAAAIADRLPGANIVRPFQIKDLNGNTVIASPAARIRKIAPFIRSNDSENTQWVFLCYKLRAFIGGSIVISP